MLSHERESDQPESGANLQREQVNRNISNIQLRPPIPIRINADNQSKGAILLYVLTFIAPLFVGLIVISFALPNSMQYLSRSKALENTNLANCTNYVQMSSTTPQLTCFSGFVQNSSNSVGDYVTHIRNLNQFLMFALNLQPFGSMQTIQGVLNEPINFKLYATNVDPATKTILANHLLISSDFQIDATYKKLKQKKLILGIESKLKEGMQFYWQVTFQPNSVINSTSYFHLQSQTVKQEFTVYTIVLRAIFFAISVAVFVRYSYLICQIPKFRVSLEQRFVHGVSGLTIMFNDQLYWITVLWPNAFTSFVNAVFVWNFFFVFFALWAIFLLRIYYEQPQNQTVEVRKKHRLIPFIIFYLVGLTYSIVFAIVQFKQHPFLTPRDIRKPGFMFLIVVTVIGFCFAFFYDIYWFCKVHSKQNLAYRHATFIYISIFLIFAIVIVILLGVLDVFVYSSALIMFTFTVMNCYSYLLQYLYSPTKEQLQEFQGRLVHVEGRRLEEQNVADVEIDLTLLDTDKMSQFKTQQKSVSSQASKSSSQSSGSYKQRMRQKIKKQRLTPRGQQSNTETKQKMMFHTDIVEQPKNDNVYNEFDIEQSQK